MTSGRSPIGRFVRAAFSARARSELLYTLVGGPLGVFGFSTIVVLLVVGAASSITFVGLPIVAVGLLWARSLGGVYRRLARRLLGLSIDAPAGPRAARGIAGRIGAALGDAAGWRAVAYVLVSFPLAVLAFVLSAAFWCYGLLLVSYPAWRPFLPVRQDSRGVPRRGMQFFGDFYADTWSWALPLAGIGVVLLLAAPWVVRGLLAIERPLLLAMLGGTRLAGRVRELEQTRAQAVDGSAATLRRIERDLHDGAQARLVAVAMRLGMAKENLARDDPQVNLVRVRVLVDNAHREAKQTLDELRDLARGIHPPILDSGLDAALTTLAARSAVPVRLRVHLPVRPSPATETILYFCVAELLTNVAKHSAAQLATVDLTQHGDRLRLRVHDDGVGGARPGDGSGLAGLADRIRPVDGHVDITSPSGGPTVITVDLPAPE
jgi:signal transduction histidine kinase